MKHEQKAALSSWAKSKALACSNNYRNKQDNFIIAFYYYHGVLLVIMDAIIMSWLNKQTVSSIVSARAFEYACICFWRACQPFRENTLNILSTSYQSFLHSHKHIGTAIIFICSDGTVDVCLCLSALFSYWMWCSRANMQTIPKWLWFPVPKILLQRYVVGAVFLACQPISSSLSFAHCVPLFYDVLQESNGFGFQTLLNSC